MTSNLYIFSVLFDCFTWVRVRQNIHIHTIIVCVLYSQNVVKMINNNSRNSHKIHKYFIFRNHHDFNLMYACVCMCICISFVCDVWYLTIAKHSIYKPPAIGSNCVVFCCWMLFSHSLNQFLLSNTIEFLIKQHFYVHIYVKVKVTWICH